MNIELIHVFRPNDKLLTLVLENKNTLGSSEFIDVYSYTASHPTRSLPWEITTRAKQIFILDMAVHYGAFFKLLGGSSGKVSATELVDMYWEYTELDNCGSLREIWEEMKNDYMDVINDMEFLDIEVPFRQFT